MSRIPYVFQILDETTSGGSSFISCSSKEPELKKNYIRAELPGLVKEKFNALCIEGDVPTIVFNYGTPEYSFMHDSVDIPGEDSRTRFSFERRALPSKADIDNLPEIEVYLVPENRWPLKGIGDYNLSPKTPIRIYGGENLEFPSKEPDLFEDFATKKLIDREIDIWRVEVMYSDGCRSSRGLYPCKIISGEGLDAEAVLKAAAEAVVDIAELQRKLKCTSQMATDEDMALFFGQDEILNTMQREVAHYRSKISEIEGTSIHEIHMSEYMEKSGSELEALREREWELYLRPAELATDKARCNNRKRHWEDLSEKRKEELIFKAYQAIFDGMSQSGK
jgi:hypothetical protein